MRLLRFHSLRGFLTHNSSHNSFSEDLARLLTWALRSYSAPEPVILSCDESDEISILDLARLIANAMDFTGPIALDISQPDGQHKKSACNARLRSLYPGTLQLTPLDEGIRQTVAWFLNNYPNIRQ